MLETGEYLISKLGLEWAITGRNNCEEHCLD